MEELIQAKQRHKFVTFWLKFSIFANIVSIISSIVSYQNLSNLGYYGMELITQGVDIEPFRNAIHPHVLILQVVAAISGICMIVCYAKLLKWRKSGFWLLVATAIVTAIINAIMMNCIKQDYALLGMSYNLNPMVTLIATPMSVFILWAILQIKQDGVSCWRQLEPGSAVSRVQHSQASNRPAPTTAPSVQSNKPSSPLSQSHMANPSNGVPLYCSQCGATLIQGAKFCQACGAPILVQGPAQHIVETPKDWESYFRNILQKNFPQFTVKENVPVTELTGDINDVFRLYKERPNQVYKAEWGKPYNFVLYSEGKAKAVIMLATTNEHSVKVTYLISKMFAKKLNVPYLGFYTKFNNKEEYVVNRIKSNLC